MSAVNGEWPRALLEVCDLSVRFQVDGRETVAVDGLSYELQSGRTLAIIGQSGSGKTVSCRALIGLLPATARIGGAARLNGAELIGTPERELRRHRGSGIAMVFQDPARALNPTMRVGHQITEVIREHSNLDSHAARERAIELLDVLLVPAPRQRFLAYSHELSGGMRQRVAIAMALAGNPKVLIADEATRALDVITQAETLRLLKSLQERMGMAMVMISHDLRMAAHVADEVLVMYAGRAVEHAPAADLFRRPRMRYTRALLDAVPRLVRATRAPLPIVPGYPPDLATLSGGGRLKISARGNAPPLLSVRNLVQEFELRSHGSTRGGVLRAVCDVSFDIGTGESLGLVGESGSGKTTLARAILQMPRPTHGCVLFRGEELTRLRGNRLLECRRFMQIVFQDPVSSLNPTWRTLDIVAEPLLGYRIGGRRERQRKIAEVLDLVGLNAATHGGRRPHELSGGQCQRVSIARALVLDPQLIVCDEALSALDVIIQAQISNLFAELRERLGLSYLFISHDLPLVSAMSNRIAVLHLGRLCEIGSAAALNERPLHPYTARLIASIPGNNLDFGIHDACGEELRRDVPSPLQAPVGCRYHTRCMRAQERCSREEPVLRAVCPDHLVACHYPLNSETAMHVAVKQESAGAG